MCSALFCKYYIQLLYRTDGTTAQTVLQSSAEFCTSASQYHTHAREYRARVQTNRNSTGMASFGPRARFFDEREPKNKKIISSNEDTGTDKSLEVTSGGPKCHAKLLEAIATLDTRKRLKTKERSEASQEVSEFNFTGGDDRSQPVKMHELMSSLANTPSHSELKKQLNSFQKNQKVLTTPLHKHDAEKVQRSVAYEAAVKEVSRWDQVVQTNRKSEHMSFPLNQATVGLQTTDQFVKTFQPSTPLEQEVYKLLHGSKHSERPNKELTLAEEETLASITLEGAKERRAELQKTQALLSYYEAKCHRKKKIKSKMYHRIQRKGRTKEEAGKLRERVKAGPEEANELLLNFDKARAKERVTLKHRNTGKWAKGLMRFGKYDHTARNLLAKQLQKSYELTTKMADVHDEEDNECKEGSMHVSQVGSSGDNSTTHMSCSDINNPWFTGSIGSHQDAEDHSKIVTLEPVSSHVKQKQKESDNDSYISDESIDNRCEKNEDEIFTDFIKPKLRQEDEQSYPLELNVHHGQPVVTVQSKHKVKHTDGIASLKTNPKDLSPLDRGHENPVLHKQEKDKYLAKMPIATSTGIHSAAPDLIVCEDQVLEKTKQHLLNIQEAFAEDDIVKVFQEEKQEHIDRDKPKDVDLSLPGWGDWGSAGVNPSKRKVKRFRKKKTPGQARRDENLQHALISEARNTKIAVHQVNQLPFPYSTSEQFQQSVRAPVGSTWNTPSVFKQLTVAKVKTKMGAIIEPISSADAFKKARKRKAPNPTHRCSSIEKQRKFGTQKEKRK
ncbi:U3 small nucleolar RNA-associated protein 14 homolog A-like [Patiria miniata]|uniref:Uncharacterized protein n=1 Tax=Patiria miniata TaxID=46514 RepID=A0A913ZC27_PATMI|nr:U3 small nucleolar RNA-associated protein 14 homolog A-like [Patiria miniata]